MTVRDNIAYGLKIKKVVRAERRRRVDEALAAVQLDDLADRRPNALSGGQQQRVALARALVVRPRVLLLDEPLSNLDARLRQDMRSEIRRICKEAGLTGLYVTHDQDEALSMADRIALLRDGKVVQCGAPTELYSKPETRFAAQFLGDTNLIAGKVVGPCDGGVVVETPLGPLRAASWCGPTPPTGNVTCSIRPEALVPHKGGGPNVLQLAPQSTVFLGERVRVMLQGVSVGDSAEKGGTAVACPAATRLQASIARPLAEQLTDGLNTFAIDPDEIVLLAD
jgi:iron(III) transport system ATP-binding protein